MYVLFGDNGKYSIAADIHNITFEIGDIRRLRWNKDRLDDITKVGKASSHVNAKHKVQ